MNSYRKTQVFFTVMAVMVFTSVTAEPIVYPAKGQSESQQAKDEGECYQWAVQKTGVDPRQVASAATSKQQNTKDHKVVKGAARGAVAGVAIGAIAGDAGKGAAIGATAGGLGGVGRERRQRKTEQKNQQQSQAQQQAQLEEYDRAYGACLAGRGYTVK